MCGGIDRGRAPPRRKLTNQDNPIMILRFSIVAVLGSVALACFGEEAVEGPVSHQTTEDEIRSDEMRRGELAALEKKQEVTFRSCS